MPSHEQLMKVLAEINDPELHRSIVELNMVRRLELRGTKATVEIALTIPGCPLKSFFLEVIPAKLKESFPEISDVDVVLGSMSEAERESLIGGIRGEASVPLARSDSPTTVIAVGSGKGGVGKSTVTVNLAAALAKRGHTVGLLDADVWGFSTPRMLGVSTQPTVVEGLILPPEIYGFKVISIGLFVPENNPVVWRGPMLHKAIQQFLADVHWDEPEYLLIDMPPGTGDVSISLASFVPGAAFVIVTTPQAAAERVAERAGHMAEKVGLKVTGVVENMAYTLCEHCRERSYPFGSGGGQELADTFRVPLLGQIPLDTAMREYADHGKPAVHSMPESSAAVTFETIVDQLTKLLPPKPKVTKRISLPLVMSSGPRT